MIRYLVTNAEVSAPLKLPFVLSIVLCSQDDTAISLSTEVAGYEFSEWLHGLCRLQEPLQCRRYGGPWRGQGPSKTLGRGHNPLVEDRLLCKFIHLAM